jgi:PhnO protein
MAYPHIRTATLSDAPELARLLTALGHPTEPDHVATRWADWNASGNTALVAIGPEEALVGLATLHKMVVLHRPMPVGRITALIVDAAARGRGVGRALVARAEVALVQAGCGSMEITSNQRLHDAHRFYEHLDYERTSVRFAKSLARD